MRGSHALSNEDDWTWGIIPAHAGLTWTGFANMTSPGDHPRACGAHNKLAWSSTKSLGSSPRMRGSQVHPEIALILHGIIPAHAGLTILSASHIRCPWDHPRACGAHFCAALIDVAHAGSSPRMRGSPTTSAASASLQGIIPAHAGLTIFRYKCIRRDRDHPRACGAHLMPQQSRQGVSGSSPRMRGSHSDI